VVIDVFTRRIIGFGIGGEYIDDTAVCRMFNRAIAGHVPPDRISTDHDPLFRFHRWLANLRILEIEEIKSVPYAPMSHPFVERLIGTVRREYLDHTFFWNSIDLHPITVAQAVQGPMHPTLGIAMDMSIQLKSASGAICTLSLSFNNDGPLGSFFRYICDNGTYVARYDNLFDG